METSSGELFAEIKIAEVHFCEESFSLINVSTLTKNPVKKFKLSNIVFTINMIIIDSIARKVEAGTPKAFLVDTVIEQRIVFRDAGDPDYCVVRIQIINFTKFEREVAWDNGDFLVVRDIIIKVASEVGVFCYISSRSAHVGFSCLVFFRSYYGYYSINWEK